ncbi:MAG: RND family efflux transporter MFP subunit [Oceanicoccus sp.]|jgi:RND family efflux transporter MFP subunit
MKYSHLLASCLAIAAFSYPQAWAGEVASLQVNVKSYPSWFTLEAEIEAVNQATISAQTTGRVQSIEVDVNDYVQAGDLIIQLRNKQQKAAVAQATAGLNQAQALNTDAQSQLTRATPLFEQGSVSKGQFDSIKANAASAAAQVKASQALLTQAQEQLSYTQIRAPYAGIVKTRLVEVGESVNPGTPLMVGLSLNQLRAVAHLPQRFISQINAQSQLQIVHNEHAFLSTKVTIFPFADSNSRSFKIRANIEAKNAGLFPGMWVKLKIPMTEQSSIRVPMNAIIRKGEASYVYIKNQNQFQLRQVRLGEQHLPVGEKGTSVWVEVLAGIKDGDEIAIDTAAVMAAQGI